MKRVFATVLAVSIAAVSYGEVYMNGTRGFAWLEGQCDDGTINNSADSCLWRTVPAAPGAADFTLRLIAANRHNMSETKYSYTDSRGKTRRVQHPAWQICLGDTLGREVTVRLATDFDDGITGFERETPQLTITGTDGKARTIDMPDGIGRGARRFQLILRRYGSNISLAAGYDEMRDVCTFAAGDDFTISRIRLGVDPGGCLEVLSLSVEEEADVFGELEQSRLSVARISEQISDSGDPRAGYWTLAGRSLDEKLMRTGGSYTLAMTPDGNGGYTLYYMEGARMNNSRWRPGMVKCRLTPLAGSRYDAVWTDAEGVQLHHDVVATMDGDNTLTVHFPQFNSSAIILQRLENYKPLPEYHADDTDP